MPPPLADLISVCRRVGARIPHWTQGPGGNVSVKRGGTLFIKPSGLRLADVKSEADIVEVDLAAVRGALGAIDAGNPAAEEAYSAALQRKHDSRLSPRKPSMETGMHVFLPQEWIFHFHSLPALLMAHEQRHRSAKVADWLGAQKTAPPVFVPALRPGLLLSRHLRNHESTTFFVLENHGVLLHGASPDVLDRWARLEERFCRDWGFDAIFGDATGVPTPLRLYFPDSAVFLDRLKAILKPAVGGGEPLYVLAPNAFAADRDVAEIWWATELLYRACPDLANLPESVSSTVANLPTEIYRRKQP